MVGNFVSDLFRNLFFLIDNVVYGLISILYELIMYLANLDLFGISNMVTDTGFQMDDNNIIFKFASRIYVLLGVIMLFQIAFAILQYIVNPNAFSDKGKGFGKLVTNCLVSLVLVVTVPFIFAFGYKIQSTILSSNILGKIILGNSSGSNVSDINSKNQVMAKDMQFLVFGTFASIEDTAFDGACSAGPVLGTKAMVTASNGDCLKQVSAKISEDDKSNIGYFFRTDTDKRDFSQYGNIINIRDDDDKYIIDYTFIISTIVGVVVVLLLISTALEIAVRAIKLAFLEIIAPIPIISYMNPLLSKANSMLGKWGKECLSTFASLFIRLAIIYFVFFMVDAITNTLLASTTAATYVNGDQPEGLMYMLVQVMVIIGLLIFANQIPKLIENITGIQMSGNFSLNPLKTITQSPLAAGVLGGAVGGAVAGLGGFGANAWNVYRNWGQISSNFKNNWNNSKGFVDKAKALGHAASPIAGIVGGGITAASMGGLAGGKGKNAITGIKSGVTGAVQRRVNRDIRGQLTSQGIGPKQRAVDKLDEIAGVRNKYGGFGQLDEKRQALKKEMDNFRQQEDAARQAKAQLESMGAGQASRDNLNRAIYDFSKLKSSMGNKDYELVNSSISWDDYNKKIQEAYNAAIGDMAKRNEINEKSLNKAQYEQYVQAANFVDEQNKQYIQEQARLDAEHKTELDDLQAQIDANDELFSKKKAELADYDRVDDIKPTGSGGSKK